MSSLENIEESLGEATDDEVSEEVEESEDIDFDNLTREDVEPRLPERASMRGKELRVDPVSGIGSETAKLTDRRQRILRAWKRLPAPSPSEVERVTDTSRSYIRYTKQDFGFVLHNEVLFQYFVGEGEDEDRQEEPTGAQMAADLSDTSDESYDVTAYIEGSEELYAVVTGLYEVGQDEYGQEILERASE